MKKRNIFKLFCLCAYIVCAVVLIVEASMDGKTSSNQSSSLGGTIANIFNDLEGDQTKAVPPTSLKITNKISEAYVGDKYEIVTETLPAEATYKSVIFTSSNDKVAKVSKSGEITFLSEGNVTVSIYNKDYTSLKDSMIINVKNVLAENISSTITDATLEDGKYTLFIGNQYTINTQFTPSNTTFKDLEYELDNTKYISVDNKGVITPKVYSAGAITNITIKHGELINTIPVTVEYKNIVSLDDITVNGIEVYVTETKSLSVTYSPSNATLKDYTVTTANSKIASVSSNKIKGVKEGSTTATVTSKYYSHISKTINVTVIKQPDLESFSVSVPSVLTIGSTYQLRINNVLPKFANTSTITYSSDNASIVSVNNSGKLTAVALGSTNIIVNGTSYPIQVVDKLDKVTTGFDISINEKYSEGLNLYTNTSYTINKDANSIALISTWYPSTPSDKTLKYEFSDPDFGSVSGNTLTLKKAGEVELTITHTPSGVSNTISLTSAHGFDIFDKDHELISSNVKMNVSDKKEFYIEDGEINEDHQTYEVLIDHAELVALENLENGGFNLSAIDEGVIDISIIPYVDNVQYSQYTKHITIETKHILTSTFVYHMYEKDSNQLLELDHGYYNLSILKTYYIDTMIDEYTTSKKLTYTSSDEKVITIDPDGNLVPVSSGIAKITLLEEKSQLFHTFQVKVLNHIELNKENTFTITGTNLVYDKDSNTYSMTNGFSGSIKLNFVSTSTYTHVSYFSSNEKVATIGSDGVITPLKVGKTTITLLCDDGIHEPIKVTINLSIERQDFIKDLGDFFRKVRKGIGHFGAFLVLGIFSTLTYLLYLNKKKMFFSVPINYAAGFALAAITEIIQLFVPGRYGAFSDVMLDFYGFLVSSTLITVVIITVEVINYIRHKKIK